MGIVSDYRPIIYQGFSSLYDYPVRINFGRFEIGEGGDLKLGPVLYYWVRDKIVGYALYHYRDWSDCLGGKIIPGGEHRHDFEGGLVRKTDTGFESVTTFHHSLKYNQFKHSPIWWVEAHGHGINCQGLHLDPEIRFSCETDWQYINLDKMSHSEWVTTQAAFGDVNMPDRWEKDGYNFWDNPDKILETMRN